VDLKSSHIALMSSLTEKYIEPKDKTTKDSCSKIGSKVDRNCIIN